MTMASIPVTVGFAIIATSQLGLGMWAVVLAALQGGTPALCVGLVTPERSVYMSYCNVACIASYSPLVPLDTYRICSLVEHKGLLLACISVALFYGASEFY